MGAYVALLSIALFLSVVLTELMCGLIAESKRLADEESRAIQLDAERK